ncbi:YraN family protein [Xanthomonas sp. XNM01]|uniref:YraN family protein n=1 Tax=Xanthomonas sp. XNM01 TaxID=2769289 RepID=UPI00177C38BE|nr:YraN family protein [Xanthomonas sp. XNM01]MBD9369485.1 YraN family protein [Xanthomonas sp. XNM01]
MAADRRERGQRIEAAARQHLQRAGLRFLAGNVGYRGGELDLVMQDDRSGTVVFVEVRYRASRTFGGGAASVDRAKRRRLIQAAQLYLAAHPALALAPCRFDVAAASGDPDAPRIDWIVDAFRLDDV